MSQTGSQVQHRASFDGWRRAAIPFGFAAALAACGGGGGGAGGGGSSVDTAAVATSVSAGSADAGANSASPAAGALVTASNVMPASRAEAARFLTQATFGPTEADIDSVMALGYGAWIDAQWSKTSRTHQADWEASNAAIKAVDASKSAGQQEVIFSFWKQAVTGDDQLRQRVAFALSQIMVVSSLGNGPDTQPRGVGQYLDMLGDKGTTTYRQLIEAVALHPMMGEYLSSMHNQKADPRTGRVPDENFAREVMQLFSIGLHKLNADGSEQLDANGQPIPTYASADVSGMAKVFTGWSWSCTKSDSSCFYGGKAADGSSDPAYDYKPMQAYAQYHSTEDKNFLGVTLAAQTAANPQADLKAALDTLASHPNVGPFIGRQLIQRLVTSNPSPAYVANVSAVFANNGVGVRGDMRAVVKAILTHPEARNTSTTAGKVREPILRLSAFLRAFAFTSDSGQYLIGVSDDPATQLGQTAMRSGSVFNFYRPGYVPAGTNAGRLGLSVPEMQIANESTAAGYVNFMRDTVQAGAGIYSATTKRRDVHSDFSAEVALADQVPALLDRLDAKLTYGAMPAALKTEIQSAVQKIAIPALNNAGSNQSSIDSAKRNRVNAAVLLTLASPEFQIQK